MPPVFDALRFVARAVFSSAGFRRKAGQAAELARLRSSNLDPTGTAAPRCEDASHPQGCGVTANSPNGSEACCGVSPERHGASMTGIMKAQIDWVPLTLGVPCGPTQGKDSCRDQVLRWLAVIFNRCDQPARLGAGWQLDYPQNQSSVCPGFSMEFDENDRMKTGHPFTTPNRRCYGDVGEVHLGLVRDRNTCVRRFVTRERKGKRRYTVQIA